MNAIAFRLLLASLAALLLELTLIRWLGAQVRIMAYFPNLVLIAAFFGLGLGCLRQGNRSLFWMWPIALTVTVVTAALLNKVAFVSPAEGEGAFFWLLYYNLPEDAPVVHNLQLPLLLFFVLTTLIFIPLGQLIANSLREYQLRGRTLKGYVYDLGGSLLGVIGFTLLSFGQTFPAVWFTCALLPGLVLAGKDVRRKLVFAGIGVVIVSGVAWSEFATAYSPYYALNVDGTGKGRGPEVISVSTNGSLHQIMLPTGTNAFPENDFVSTVSEGFHRPFDFLKTPPRSALVLGAGTGNDVAVLLEEGVTEIDAVEIDPVIQEIGEKLHPDSPYASPLVNVHITDARSFLNTTDKKYDLVVFGTLDSMTRLSALSNVRLDNFVYTRESIAAAKSLLTDNGGMILHFMVGDMAINAKIVQLLYHNFDELPGVLVENRRLFNRTFMAGPAFADIPISLRGNAVALWKMGGTNPNVIPTDDWPYLYLESRSISRFYGVTILSILAMASVLFAIFGRGTMRRKSGRSFAVPMFLFGAAFLMLNTKAVTQIGLVWGNTWLTNSIAFASILAVILISTVVFSVRPLPLKACFYALFGSLLLLAVLPPSLMIGLPVGAKFVATAAYVGLPFFFAGACFAGVFRLSEDVPKALGWNVIGALVGGLAEYLNMLFGFNFLNLLALALYLGAFVLFFRRREASTALLQEKREIEPAA